MVADHCSSEPLSPRRQLTQYLEEVVELNKAPENVFKFWKEHTILYPKLSILAFQVLCVPASSAPVERVFKQTTFAFSATSGQAIIRFALNVSLFKVQQKLCLIVIFAFSVHCSIKIFRFQIFFCFRLSLESRNCIVSVSTKRSRNFRVSKT